MVQAYSLNTFNNQSNKLDANNNLFNEFILEIGYPKIDVIENLNINKSRPINSVNFSLNFVSINGYSPSQFDK